jgi:actin-like ATPase involved in cell morphogenesis
VPRAPVLEHVARIEARHAERIKQYKTYAVDLKEKYREFELESHRHYAHVIKNLQVTKDEIIDAKEELIEQLTEQREKANDELAQLRQRLYQARTEDKIQKMLMAAF